ncbi:MAG: hypothetical protein COA82_03735 [Alkaliphilus sp.]|nr:MAG: hypothetical protein COA82_03735 [Alkaliphilus sp.]
MPTNKGVIYTLKTYSRTLVIQMKNSLFMAVDRNTLEVNNITVALGKGDIFDVIPDEQIADDGGYIGCCDRWASFVCKLGYVVVDAVNFDRGKIILYNGKVNEISAIKMFNHFRDHTHIIAKEEDNPFRLQGWSGAYDEKFNRLVFSKKNARDVRNNRFENIGISYSQEANGGQGGWVSFHSANANTLFHNRQGIFSVFNFNLQVNGVFKQNFNDLYGEYFTATSKEKSYIDFVFNRGGSTVMMLNNITWQLVSYLGSDKDSEFEHGLTSIMVYTNNQCSGEIALVATSNLIPSPNMVRYVEGIFQFDGFRDLAIDPNIRSVSDTGVLVTSNIATTKPWYDKGRFINTFFFVRATYDNVSNRNVNIEVLEVNVQKSNR